MVFVKVDADFVEINRLSDMSTVPIEQIEEFLDKGLLDDISSAEECYPQYIDSLRKVKVALGLDRMNLSSHNSHNLMYCLNDDNQMDVQSTLQSFGISDEDSETVVNYLRARKI